MVPSVIILTSVAGADLNSAAIVARQTVPQVILVENRSGYGAALSAAFATAGELGCTHAVVLDVGRGHSPAFLQQFIDAACEAPEAIVLGVAGTRGIGPLSASLGRWHCDVWTWAETGRWIHDTTYGFKAYPLHQVRDLAVRAVATDFEVELLAKSVWAGLPVVEIPLPTMAHAGGLAPLTLPEVARLWNDHGAWCFNGSYFLVRCWQQCTARPSQNCQ